MLSSPHALSPRTINSIFFSRLLLAALVASYVLVAPATAQIRIVEPTSTISAATTSPARNSPATTLPNTTSPATVQTALERGVALEREDKWAEALGHYEEALKAAPGDRQLSERADVAKIHYSLIRRYADNSFRNSIKTLSAREALDLYSEILLKIQTHFVHDADWQALVRRGTQTLEIALRDRTFTDHNLAAIPAERWEAALLRTRSVVDRQPIYSRTDAVAVVAQAAQIMHQNLGLNPSSVIMEYLSGATGGLDSYSTYLTGDQLREVYSQIDGSFVGLGIEMKAENGSLLIVSVISGSPAEASGLVAGDRIVSVDGQATQDITTEKAAALLQGTSGSVAELIVASTNGGTRILRVRRANVEVRSIQNAKLIDPAEGIAYLRIDSFQRDTNRDLDATLWKLYRAGMKSLVIDVRGNPGGLLSSAVDVADKFVYQGRIVSTRGRNHEEDFDYSARPANTWGVPLVVLIDNDSASASEIFAAAIRDHRRGTIVGTRTYGKGSVQGIFPLGYADAGLRLTTAKFYSPQGQAISGAGVSPDLQVHEVAKRAPGAVPANEDRVLQAGVQAARTQMTRR